MKKPDIPENEQTRLETLRSLSILDTPPEEEFDRFTRIAKRLFNVPMALVSLVDENRQWFKSCMGLDATETPRDISFCGHAILGDRPFIINNALEDERFSDNPLVTGAPHIRFYAGVPLSTPNGSKLGTLCIIDREPRALSNNDLEALVDLAAMVEHELSAIQLATMDELTEISNRRGFVQLAEHSISLCARENLPASLVYMDLNNFKFINDTFGHAEGDHALMMFSEQLSTTFRDSDIVARLGGDEFVALLIDNDKQVTEEAISRLSQLTRQYNQTHDKQYDISFSYGIVEFDFNQHHTIDDLLKDGDTLMYKQKLSQRKISSAPQQAHIVS